MNVLWLYKINTSITFEASRGAGAQSVTVNASGCGFDPHSRKWNIYSNFYFHFFALVLRQSAVLSSATQYAMPPEFSGNWGPECLNTRFPITTLLCPNTAWSWFNLTFLFRQYVCLYEYTYFKLQKSIDLVHANQILTWE